MKRFVAMTLIASFLLLSTVPAAVYAADKNMGQQVLTQNATGLTMQKAVDMAINHSRSLKKAQLDVERSEEISSSARDKVSYIPSGPTPDYTGQIFTAALAAQISWEMNKKAKNMQEDQLTLSVINEYINVLKAQKNLEVAKASEREAFSKWNIAILSYQEGVISDTMQQASKKQHDLALKGVTSAQLDLDSAYQNLNKLIGLSVSERPVLTEKPAFELAELDSAELMAQRALDSNPNVWLAQQNVDLAKIQLDLYDWTNPMRDPYETKKIDVEKAELTAADTREQMKQFVITLHNNILKLETAYASQEYAIQLQEDNLRVLKTKYDLGMIKKMDLESAELELLKAKKSLDETAYQHEILKMAIEKPWAYAGAMSGSEMK